MKGFYFKSKKGNVYFYNDLTGLIEYVDKENHEYKRNNKYIKFSLDRRINSNNKEIFANQEVINEYLYIGANGFKQLLIETTSQCNLRCKYCVYSDHYEYTKSYDDSFMNFETAKLAIDYYFENFKKINYRNPTRVPAIGFYGGEPLINFKLIKEVVEYINLKYSEYDEIQYNITTNGLLLKKDIADFLVEHNFAIIVSLDGYKENHDRNRVKINGQGSFDEVIGNIKKLKQKYNDFQKLAISACYDIKSDLLKYIEFFDNEKLFIAKLSPIDPNNTTYYDQFTMEEKQNYIDNHNKLRKLFLNKAKNGCICKDSCLYTIVGINYSELAVHPVLAEKRPDFLPFTASCVPGEKIYVTTDGKFHICEKINPNYPIGDVENGLDWTKICNLINDYRKAICTKCSTCNVTRFCTLCFQHCATDKKLKKPLDACEKIESHIKNMLINYIDVLEVKPDLFDHITVDYYNTIYEMAGMILE